MANDYFTIASFDPRPSSAVQVLRGSVADVVTDMEIEGGVFSGIQLGAGAWTAVVGLEQGLNSVVIRALGTGLSAQEEVGISLPELPIDPFNNHNTFDDQGIFLGLPRNLGEKNLRYKRRLLDQFLHRAGITLQPLTWAISRELGLENVYDAVRVYPARHLEEGSNKLSNPELDFVPLVDTATTWTSEFWSGVGAEGTEVTAGGGFLRFVGAGGLQEGLSAVQTLDLVPGLTYQLKIDLRSSSPAQVNVSLLVDGDRKLLWIARAIPTSFRTEQIALVVPEEFETLQLEIAVVGSLAGAQTLDLTNAAVFTEIGALVAAQVFVESTATKFSVHSRDFRVRKTGRIDSASLEFPLDDRVSIDPELWIRVDGGSRITGWKYLEDRNILRFEDVYAGADIVVEYGAVRDIEKAGKTVSVLLEAVKAATQIGALPAVVFAVLDEQVLSLPAVTLMQFPPTDLRRTEIVGSGVVSMDFSEVLVINLAAVKQDLLGPEKTGLQEDGGTLEDYVATIRSASRFEWERTLVDGTRTRAFDTWGTRDVRPDLDSLPALMDGSRSMVGGHQWQSGVGVLRDLQAELAILDHLTFEEELQRDRDRREKEDRIIDLEPVDFVAPEIDDLPQGGYGVSYGTSYGFL